MIIRSLATQALRAGRMTMDRQQVDNASGSAEPCQGTSWFSGRRLVATVALIAAGALASMGSARLQAASPQADPSSGQAAVGKNGAPSAQPLVRELFVPYEDLDVVLKVGGRRVFLTRDEYEALLAKAQTSPEAAAPRAWTMLSTQYLGRIQQQQCVLEGTIEIEVLRDGLQRVPLSLQGVGILEASLDGKPAAVASDGGKLWLFVEGRGKHRLQLQVSIPVTVTDAHQVLQFRLPQAGAGKLQLQVDGEVEVHDGATVLGQSVTAGTTQLTLLPDAQQTRLVLSLNQDVIDQQQIVVARTVLVDELTSTYQRLHVTAAMQLVRGSAQSFRFAIPSQFEVTNVTSPLLASWQVTRSEGQDILAVQLRESATGTQVVNIAAQQNQAPAAPWQMPQFQPLDVAATVSVVGLLVEDRLQVRDLQTENLIPIDLNTFTSTLPSSVFAAEPGAPALAPVVAYFSPDNQYQLIANWNRQKPGLEVLTQQVLSISDTRHRLRCQFQLRPLVEQTFQIQAELPTGWEVTEVRLATGQPLDYTVNVAEDGKPRVDVEFPAGIEIGQGASFNLIAENRPAGWLETWDTQDIVFPSVAIAHATDTQGALAVRAEDDLLVRDLATTGLRMVDDGQKQAFGLGDENYDLAYRFHQAQHMAKLQVQRVPARVTAEAYSFIKLSPAKLQAEYELAYDIADARVQTLSFALPIDTPAEISITGLGGHTVKDFVGQQQDTVRLWTVNLAEPVRGQVRLRVAFEQAHTSQAGSPTALDATTDAQRPARQQTLPIVRAEAVNYQTGALAVEGSAELEIAVKTDARHVDIGELSGAEYEPGRRLLGAYGYVGPPPQVIADVRRPAQYGLPTAIVERAELVSSFSAAGACQTAARFRLQVKSAFLEIQLPKQASLWSAYLDGRPTKPQRSGDRLLLSMQGKQSQRDLQLVYEQPAEAVDWWGTVQAAAPRLFLPQRVGGATVEVPQAQLQWHVALPPGYQLLSSSGNVYPDSSDSRVTRQLRLHGIPPERLAKQCFDAMSPLASVINAQAKFETASASAPAVERAMPQLADGEALALGEEDSLADAPAVPRQPSSFESELESAREQQQTSLQQASELGRVAPATGALWAMQGLRSLKIDLTTDTPTMRFVSLGREPKLRLTLVNTFQTQLLAWGLGGLAFSAGLCWIRRSLRLRLGYIGALMIITCLLPQIFDLPQVLGKCGDAVFLAALALLPIYITCSLFQRVTRISAQQLRRWWWAPRTVAMGMLVVGMAVVNADSVLAQETTEAQIGDIRVKLMGPAPKVEIPPNVVIVPYNPAAGTAAEETNKIIVPYQKYVELWDRAYPTDANKKAPPAEYALSAARWEGQLQDDDSLLLKGTLTVRSYVDRLVAVPLQLGSGVLELATLNGAAARLASSTELSSHGKKKPQRQNRQQLQQAVQAEPAKSVASVLLIDKQGTRDVQLAIRFPLKRQGGWRMVNGRLPGLPAASLKLSVPAEQTELRIATEAGATEVTTERAEQVVTAALGRQGRLRLQWRPQVGKVTVDQSLTAKSDAVLDVQEDCLRLTWHTKLAFPRAVREDFELELDPQYVVQKVTGANVRDWRRDGQRIVVRLLSTAQDHQALTVHAERRAAVGQPDFQSAAVPTVNVVGAVLHEGQLALRRSPLLRIWAQKTSGLVRTDLASVQTAKATASESPLGIKAYQAYRFARAPFDLQLGIERVRPEVRADVRAVLNLSEHRQRLEVSVQLQTNQRPLHHVQMLVPGNFRPRDIIAPEIAHTSKVALPDGRQQLSIYLAGGLTGRVTVLLNGDLAPPLEDSPTPDSDDRDDNGAEADLDATRDTISVPVPRISVLDVAQQQTTLVVQADSSYRVNTQDLRQCESVLLDRTYHWLKPEQRPSARMALRAEKAEYSGDIQLVRRQPQIVCRTISNLRVTQRAFEETVLLDYSITEAGVREIAFLLPVELREASIHVPLLRRKLVESVSADQVRVRLWLKDAVLGQLRVLVTHSSLVSSEPRAVPIPVIETGKIDAQFVALESQGRDEVVVVRSNEVHALGQQQTQWQTLAKVLGDQVTQAYWIPQPAAAPQLVVQAKDRQQVRTVGARIPFAETKMTVDEGGTYRATQIYQVTNRTEQFLDVRLPNNATLWTTSVAGTEVKPITGQQMVRVPLVKTAEGETDYAVQLQYGGTLGELNNLQRVRFPLLQTANIKVEENQVRLHLPKSRRWMSFAGTLQRVQRQEDLMAGFLKYKNRQILDCTSGLSSSNVYARLRQVDNLKRLSKEFEGLMEPARGRQSAKLQRQLESNRRALEIARRQMTDDSVLQAEPDIGQNGERMNSFFLEQRQYRAVDTPMVSNFSDMVPEIAEQEQAAKVLNQAWVDGNSLSNAALGDLDNGRVQYRLNQAGQADARWGRNNAKQAMPGGSVSGRRYDNGRRGKGYQEKLTGKPNQRLGGGYGGGYGEVDAKAAFDNGAGGYSGYGGGGGYGYAAPTGGDDLFGEDGGGQEAKRDESRLQTGGMMGGMGGMAGGGGYGGGGGGYGGRGGGRADGYGAANSTTFDFGVASNRHAAPPADEAAPGQTFQSLGEGLKKRLAARPESNMPSNEALAQREGRKLARFRNRLSQRDSESQTLAGESLDTAGAVTQATVPQGVDLSINGIAAPSSGPQSAFRESGLASLSVEFEAAGVEYLFTAPGGDMQISARPLETRLVERWTRAGLTLLAAAVFAGVLWRLPNRD